MQKPGMQQKTLPGFYVCKIVDGNEATAVQPVKVNKGSIPKEAADYLTPFSVFQRKSPMADPMKAWSISKGSFSMAYSQVLYT